jgi:hypothetical protein
LSIGGGCNAETLPSRSGAKVRLMSATIAPAESPIRPVLQRDECLRGILALAEKAIAGQECHRVDTLALCQIVLDALDYLERAPKRCLRGREHVSRDEALVVDR